MPIFTTIFQYDAEAPERAEIECSSEFEALRLARANLEDSIRSKAPSCASVRIGEGPLSVEVPRWLGRWRWRDNGSWRWMLEAKDAP
jgi:hypothetical protein